MPLARTMLLHTRLYESDRPTVDTVAQVDAIDGERHWFYVPLALARHEGIMVEVLDGGERSAAAIVTGEALDPSQEGPHIVRVPLSRLEEA